jgi:hypothetical protein
MKNFIFKNQQALCAELEIQAETLSEDIVHDQNYYDVMNIVDEISCIGTDVEQLDYVMGDLIAYLEPAAKRVLNKAIKTLKGRK